MTTTLSARKSPSTTIALLWRAVALPSHLYRRFNPPELLIIHDNDNNLVSENVTFHAYRAIMAACGVSKSALPSIELLSKDYTGKRYEGALQDLENKYGFNILDHYTDYKIAYETLVIHEQIKYLELLPFVRGTLGIFRRAGVEQCVATNNSREVVKNGYRILGLSDYFSSIISADDVASNQHKPHPKLLLLAMEKYGASTKGSIIVHVEDSNSGLEAGHRAGIKNLVWHNARVPEELRSQRADVLEQKGIVPAAIIADYAGLIEFAIKVAPPKTARRLEVIVDELNTSGPQRFKNKFQNAAANAQRLEIT